jgi:hypothetical protein
MVALGSSLLALEDYAKDTNQASKVADFRLARRTSSPTSVKTTHHVLKLTTGNALDQSELAFTVSGAAKSATPLAAFRDGKPSTRN